MDEYEIYNPHNKPIEELPFIYGFNNGGRPEWYMAQLIAEDGTPLGSHLCSHELYMPGDLGILKGSRPDRHETFRKHYPDGYRMDFVSHTDIDSHPGLSRAIENNKTLPDEAKSENEQTARAVVEFSDGTKIDAITGKTVAS